jgi:hypothetical protein
VAQAGSRRVSSAGDRSRAFDGGSDAWAAPSRVEPLDDAMNERRDRRFEGEACEADGFDPVDRRCRAVNSANRSELRKRGGHRQSRFQSGLQSGLARLDIGDVESRVGRTGTVWGTQRDGYRRRGSRISVLRLVTPMRFGGETATRQALRVAPFDACSTRPCVACRTVPRDRFPTSRFVHGHGHPHAGSI